MSILNKLLGIIAPHNCILCNGEGSVLCQSCGNILPVLPSVCFLCGKATHNNALCTNHNSTKSPSRVFIFSEYKDEIKNLVHEYKFKYKRAAAIDIARLMGSSLPYYPEAPFITYVPTIGSHVRERGFDHSKLVAKEIARQNNWHYAPLLHKTKSIKQKGKGRQERKAQLKNALEAININLIKNKNILLVDDVITTGATVEECTKKLYKAGAKDVDVVVLARTP